MDVLDHSCSKLGFGGKMCIDGTKKQEEEITMPLIPFKFALLFHHSNYYGHFPGNYRHQRKACPRMGYSGIVYCGKKRQAKPCNGTS